MTSTETAAGPGSHRPALVAHDLLPGDTAERRAVRAAHRVYENLVQLWAPGVIEAADEVGLYRALAGGPATAKELAAALELDAQATRLMLDALCVYEITSREPAPGGEGEYVYSLPDDLRDCLLPGLFSLVGKMAYDRMSAWGAWRNLAEAIRHGATDAHGHQQVNQIPAETYRTLVGGINFWAPPIVDVLAEELGRRGWDEAARRRMVDVGCGTGLYSHLLLRRFGGLRAEGLDVPEILELADAQAARLGLAERFTGRAVDFTRQEWGAGLDLVLLANIFEMQTPDSALDLVRRAARALAPGGLLAIVDQIVDDRPDSSQDRFATLFAVSMLATGGGDSYRAADYEVWFAAAGLRRAALLDTPMHRILVARRAF